MRLAILIAVVGVLSFIASAMASYFLVQSLRNSTPPSVALVNVNVTGVKVEYGRLLVSINVQTLPNVNITGGLLYIYGYGLATAIPPGAGQKTVSLPLVPSLIGRPYIIVGGYVNFTYPSAYGYTTFTQGMVVVDVVNVTVNSVTMNNTTGTLLVSLNTSLPATAWLNITGQVVWTDNPFAPGGEIVFGPTCKGNITVPFNVTTVNVTLTGCAIHEVPHGRWYFEGVAQTVTELPSNNVTKNIELFYWGETGEGS